MSAVFNVTIADEDYNITERNKTQWTRDIDNRFQFRLMKL